MDETKVFRKLYADEIELRVGNISEKGLTLLLYKTARTDAKLLDETVGPDNWQNDFKLIDGVLFGGIGTRTDKGDWVWKWDCGTESYTEKEKGRASDAYKRAGFKVGIGRELYTGPKPIYIPQGKCEIKTGKNGKLACYDDFIVDDISYSDDAIIGISIKNAKTGSIVYAWNANKSPARKETTPVSEVPPKCPKCGSPTRGTKDKDGNIVPPVEVLKKLGMCATCYRAEAKANANNAS